MDESEVEFDEQLDDEAEYLQAEATAAEPEEECPPKLAGGDHGVRFHRVRCIRPSELVCESGTVRAFSRSKYCVRDRAFSRSEEIAPRREATTQWCEGAGAAC